MYKFIGLRVLAGACVLASFALLAGCGSSSAAPADWFYHWNCNGDSQCLGANPTGQPSGTSDEGNETSCDELLNFGNQFWNIPPATQSCDQNPNGSSGGGGTATVTVSSFSPSSTAPGNNVTITGSNFPAAPTVTIDGVTCTVVSVTSTTIVVTLPAMGNFTGPIVVDGVSSTGSIKVFNHFYGVVSASNQTVAVGGYTTLSGSVTGSLWNTINLGASQYLSAAAAIGTGTVTLVTVGQSGAIYSNVTGNASYVSRTSGTSQNLFGVGSSTSLFVAVGAGGTVVTSPDGTVWTARTSHTTETLAGVAWCSTQFIAVGGGGTIITSPDGTTWTTQTSGTTKFLNAVACSGPLVVVGEGSDSSTGEIVTSPDGIIWTQRPLSLTDAIYGVAWSNTQFVAVGLGGTIFTSPDGITWTARSSGTTDSLNAVTWSSLFSQFVAVGGFGTILTSPDGVTWTAHTP